MRPLPNAGGLSRRLSTGAPLSVGSPRRAGTARVMHPASGVRAPLQVKMVGAASWNGQPQSGTELAREALRAAGVARVAQEQGWRVQDLGDIKFAAPSATAPPPQQPGLMRNSAMVGEGCERLSIAVREAAVTGSFVLNMGGDHSVAAGSIPGMLAARPDLGVIWVDAHADISTPDSSPTGNAHGMPLAVLLQLGVDATSVRGFEWLGSPSRPRLCPSSPVYIALRDLDAGEKAIIREAGILAFTMSDIDRLGIGGASSMVTGAIFSYARRSTAMAMLPY